MNNSWNDNTKLITVIKGQEITLPLEHRGIIFFFLIIFNKAEIISLFKCQNEVRKENSCGD